MDKFFKFFLHSPRFSFFRTEDIGYFFIFEIVFPLPESILLLFFLVVPAFSFISRGKHKESHQEPEVQLTKEDSSNEQKRIKDEIDTLEKHLSEASSDFEQLATGVDTATFSEKRRVRVPSQMMTL